MGYCISITWKDLLPFPTYLGAFTRFFHFVVVVFWGFFCWFWLVGFFKSDWIRTYECKSVNSGLYSGESLSNPTKFCSEIRNFC